MTIENMHIAVKLELDKSAALELPAFEDEEIDFWLNNAIQKFVKTRYSGMNVKKTSFEETQKRTDDLRTLIDMTTISQGAFPSLPDSVTFSLPASYWFTLQEEASILVGGVTTVRVGIVECTLDEYRQKLDDPFSEHILHYGTAKPLRIFNNASVELIYGSGYYPVLYYLTYLKKPTEVEINPTVGSPVDCNLPEHTHTEIVKLAVSMMLENIEQPRYQTYQNEVNTME